MKHCPTCRAEYSGKPHCHRCGMDFGPLLDIEQKARAHHRNALDAYAVLDYESMYFHAKRAGAPYRSLETVRLLACAALMTGRFEQALSLYAGLKRSGG